MSTILHRRIFLLFFLWLIACAPTPKRVELIVDGNRRVFETNAVTVQDVLNEQGVNINADDKIEPPPFAEVGRGTTITITRLDVKTEAIEQPIPFARQLVRDETYPQGQVRIVQLGTNGTVVITYTLTIENGKEIARRESGRQVITQPQDEILALGTKDSIAPVALTNGTLAYIANGNAWVMRHSSSDKRALTSTNDLDGRVFSLSPDGRYLLFSRNDANALNTLWVIDTLVLGETPRQLPVNDVLFAQLAPDAKSLAYSTGEKTSGAPGWKAHNDLWIMPVALDAGLSTKMPVQVWQTNFPAPLSWWGANFVWSPDGRAMAYSFTNEIGLIEFGNQPPRENMPRRVLKQFAPFKTNADWVWVPRLTWSPDSRFIVTTIHAPLSNAQVATDDPTFEIWALARDGSVNAALAKQTGMWASPVWSPPDARGESRVAFGSAVTPSNSERSRYALWMMDRDGGNKKQIFPKSNEDALTLTQFAWSPDAKQIVAVRDNDLWLYDVASSRWAQLTANGASSLPRWAK